MIERKDVGEAIRASQTIADDNAEFGQARELAVGVEVKDGESQTHGFPVQSVCEPVTRRPCILQCCPDLCALGLVDRVGENARRVEGQPAKATRCSRERRPGGFDFSLVHDSEATRNARRRCNTFKAYDPPEDS